MPGDHMVSAARVSTDICRDVFAPTARLAPSRHSKDKAPPLGADGPARQAAETQVDSPPCEDRLHVGREGNPARSSGSGSEMPPLTWSSALLPRLPSPLSAASRGGGVLTSRTGLNRRLLYQEQNESEFGYRARGVGQGQRGTSSGLGTTQKRRQIPPTVAHQPGKEGI